MSLELVKLSQITIDTRIIKYYSYPEDSTILYAIDSFGNRNKINFHESKIVQVDKISNDLIHQIIINDKKNIIVSIHFKKNYRGANITTPKVTKFDATDEKDAQINEYTLDYSPESLEIDDDNVYIGDQNGNINIHELKTMKKINVIEVNNSIPVRQMIIMDNYSKILIRDGINIHLFNLADFTLIKSDSFDYYSLMLFAEKNDDKYMMSYRNFNDIFSAFSWFDMDGIKITDVYSKVITYDFIVMQSMDTILLKNHANDWYSSDLTNVSYDNRTGTSNLMEKRENYLDGANLSKLTDNIIIAEKKDEIEFWTTKPYAAELRKEAFLLGTISNASPINQSYKSNWMYESKLNKLILEYLP